jgi:PemK-like, MazF-like toxin of type II toxin-antitoxin system
MTKKAPKKGDVVLMDFDPQAGHEQAGHRLGLVITTKAFNAKTGFAFICPITNQSKGYPFEVIVEGTQRATGVFWSINLSLWTGLREALNQLIRCPLSAYKKWWICRL